MCSDLNTGLIKNIINDQTHIGEPAAAVWREK